MTTTYSKTLFADSYKDDFDDQKNFHRVLFNSGKALQARELTQMQTIIQAEIARFGSNIFKDGAAVNSGTASINKNYKFVKLNTTSNTLPGTSIVGATFENGANTISAKVLEVVEATGSDPATLYVQYTNASGGSVFPAGIDIDDGTNTLSVQTTDTVSNPATGSGTRLSSNGGDFFVYGHFVFAADQSLIISKYTKLFTGEIGFKITQDVVGPTDDSTLYDNQGATPNLSSPGADRYRIQLTLIDKANALATDNFVFFTKIIDSKIVDQAKGSDFYNTIGGELARRTKEESGNYFIKPFTLQYDLDSASATTKLVADVSGGLAYIDGYRTEVIGATPLTIDRSLTTKTLNNEVVAANYGNYVLATTVKGLPNITTHVVFNIRSAVTHGGSTIGTARVRSVAKHGTDYKYYLSHVTMNAGQSFQSAKSIGTSTTVYADLILENSKGVLKETANNNLFFPTPRERPKAITDISLEVQRRFTGTASGTAVTITLSATGETFTNTSDWIVVLNSSGVVQPATFGAVGTQSMVISNIANGASTILAKVNKSAGVQRTKTQTLNATKSSANLDSDGTDSAESQKWLSLGQFDVNNIQEIKDSATGNLDYSSMFTLDDGQRQNHYAHSRLILNGDQAAPPVVYAKFDHLTHGAAGDFFGVGSYTGQVAYGDISSVRMDNGSLTELRDVLDFRPSIDSAGTLSLLNELPAPSNLITSDITYYEGRRDKLVVFPPRGQRLRSELSIIEGVPAEHPKYPATPTDAFELYRMEMGAGTINDSDLSMSRTDAKRYTMADIGKIDRKLDALSEATTLSLLELDTNNLTITDSAGVNRLKTGFLVDNFKNHVYSDTDAIDYRASVDLLQKSLHTSFKEDNVRLIYDSDLSTNTIKKGDNVYVNHTEVIELDQNKVSGTQNLNPFNVVTYNSEMVLSPASDEWKQVDMVARPPAAVPAVTVSKKKRTVVPKQKSNYNNSSVYWYGMTDGELEHHFGSGIPSWAWDQGLITGNGNLTSFNSHDVPDAYYNTMPVAETVTEVIYDRVVSTTIVPYMRSRKVYFKTSGLVPNSTYFAFFGGRAVASWVREETFAYHSDDVEDYGNRYGNATAHPDGATALVADANGAIEGSFFIPNTPAIRFRTGAKEFALLDISIYDKNSATSTSTAMYTSSGAIETRQGPVTCTKSLLQTPGYYDPIAQSFLVTQDKGYFATKVSIYFKAKDATIPVKVTLRPMVNGHPSSYDIIPGSIVWKNPGDVTLVGTQTSAGVYAAPTDFVFDEPIFLSPNQEYAICVSAESNVYEVYVSKIREFELGSTEKRITRQPSLGSLFLSQNGSLWSPTQDVDLMFKMHRASFDTAGGTVIMENTSLAIDQLPTNPISTIASDATVTMHQPGHGFIVNESVTISGLGSSTLYGGITGANINGARTITAIDYDHYTFEAGAAATGTTHSGGDIVSATRNQQFNIATPYIENIIPSGSAISVNGKFTTGSSVAGSETRFAKDTAYVPISNKTPKIFDAPRMIAHLARETTSLGSGVRSATIQIPMVTTSELVSPVIDMSRSSLSTVSHEIDKQASVTTSGYNVPINYQDEVTAENGSALAKHITTPIGLAEAAVGLKVLISAHRPSVSDFVLYYRLAEDGEILKDKRWTLIAKENEIPSDENPLVSRDYEYLIGGEGGLEGINAFTEFQLKIVLRSTSSSKVPVIKNLRAIALAV